MNARRRARPDGLPSRVYAKAGAYYWVRHDNKWIKLSRIDEGERALERVQKLVELADGALGVEDLDDDE